MSNDMNIRNHGGQTRVTNAGVTCCAVIPGR